MIKELLLTFIVLVAVNTAIAAPPANDNLANAAVLSGATGTINGTTVDATNELVENNHATSPTEAVFRTVWYTWTAPETKPAAFEVATAQFDGSMAVYTGSAYPLTTVARNNDTNGTRPRIEFMATAGTSYRIVIGIFNSSSGAGTFTLNWSQTTTPSNDAFANARVIPTNSGYISMTTLGASSEPNEPLFGIGRTVWFSYTNPGPADISLTFRTIRSIDPLFDTRLAVYTGAAPGSLTSIVRSDNVPSSFKSAVTFLAKSGVTYRIAADIGSGSPDGNLAFDWNISRPPAYTDFGTNTGPGGEVDLDQAVDITVFRPSNGVWYSIDSFNATYSEFQFGVNGDRPVPADYDGDGRTDYAVTRGSGGLKTWYIRNSFDGTYRIAQWGLATDREVPGDFDNDGRVDIAVFRPSTNVWYIWRSSDLQFTITQFGLNGDIPVLGDFAGTPQGADIAVFRPSTGQWFILNGANTIVATFGTAGDRPVPADYDFDERTDLAVFRPSTGTWYYLESANESVNQVTWGLSTDIPMTGDYDNNTNDKADIAVFRPSTNTWYILRSEGFFTDIFTFGLAGDIPVSSLSGLMQ